MAYSDYGGYAYRNGARIEERSDATISPESDVFGSPGMWPGLAAMMIGGEDEYQKRREWPTGHVVLGDGPIYVVLYKQSSVSIHRGLEKLDMVTLLKDAPPKAIASYKQEGETLAYVDTEYFTATNKRCVFEVDGWRLEVFWRHEDNYYQYARLAQPDGNVWHGWSGYGVGAGLEDCGYGFSTDEREETLLHLWPESIVSGGSSP